MECALKVVCLLTCISREFEINQSRIQQRMMDSDPREDIVVNHVHPGYVDTDMTSHKGPLTIDRWGL